VKDLNRIRDEAQNRKNLVKEVAVKHGIDAKAVMKMREVYEDGEVEETLTFKEFVKFLRLDDTPLLRNTFDLLAGNPNGHVETKLILLFFINCSLLGKEQRLEFAFELYDEDECKIITYKELLKILQGNYFAGNTAEVERKARLILDEAKSKTGDDAITYEDFMALAKKFSSLFFPTNL